MIKLIKSTFFNEKETIIAIKSFLDKSRILSFNHECERFEKKFSKYQGSKYSIFVNSGSSANLAIIQALLNLGKIKKGAKVGFSALTWSTNVMPLIQLGLIPVPIDVELDTLNVSSRSLIETIKRENIQALFLTNALGFCDDIDQIQLICKDNNIVLIEDNCESLGTVFKGKLLGNYGYASTFSFYVGHHMSTIEGGMICTNDDELASMLRLVRAHGWDRNLSKMRQTKIRKLYEVNSTFYSRYTFYDLGYNLRPTEINGFIGNKQIRYVPKIVRKREENFIKIASAIYSNSERYLPLKYSHIDTISNFAVPVICISVKIRDELVKKCEGVLEIRPIIGGDMTQQPFFKKYVGDKRQAAQISNATIIHRQGLYFGNNPEMTQAEIKKIIRIFTE